MKCILNCLVPFSAEFVTPVDSTRCMNFSCSNQGKKQLLEQTSVTTYEVLHYMERYVLLIRFWVGKGHIHNWMSSRFYGLEFGELIQLKLELLKYIERKFKCCLCREEVDDFSYKLFVESKNFNSTLPVSFTFNTEFLENR